MIPVFFIRRLHTRPGSARQRSPPLPDGGEDLHLRGLDQEAGLAGGNVRKSDDFEVAGDGQLAALPGIGSTELGQRAAHLDGNEVGEPAARLIPLAAIRGDAQDGMGLALDLTPCVYCSMSVVSLSASALASLASGVVLPAAPLSSGASSVLSGASCVARLASTSTGANSGPGRSPAG